ncbi:LPXTG cell wall anchor domain-containing protein [Streptomyces sp. NPDC092296]|uniref:LPXTG cell wall anchor domain-containing protein n=1 Tax=Streptomyces sp. NPDC092296 TaxID=3366012 RepID=UPI0038221204
MSNSRRTRAAQFLGAAAITTAAVLGGAGSAQAASSDAEQVPSGQLRPASAEMTPLLADTGSRDTGLLVVYAGLLLAAGGGAMWALRRRQEPVGL